MQLYGRGIRRRLAPMLGNDRRHIELAYLLQFSLPGTPVLRYGEEIGMGDDLSLQQRDSIRTPMQWSRDPQAGFTNSDKPVRPVIDKGDFSYRQVNVTDQEADPESLLAWFERMLRALRECPEFGVGSATVLDPKLDSVLALRYDAPCGSMIAVINLLDEPATIDLSPQPGVAAPPLDTFANRQYPQVSDDLSSIELDGWGYRWIRLSRVLGTG
jgi:maltose alpha-D-glucosyltransferase / alpha-amylase